MKLQNSQFGRKIKMQFWLSDWSGHGGILDMLESFEGSQSEIGIKALAHLASETTGETIESTPQRITRDMQQILAQAKAMQQLALEVMAKALTGQISQETGVSYAAQMDAIKEQMLVIQGAGNYGGELLEVEADNFGEWD